jgi:hypothetical protein
MLPVIVAEAETRQTTVYPFLLLYLRNTWVELTAKGRVSFLSALHFSHVSLLLLVNRNLAALFLWRPISCLARKQRPMVAPSIGEPHDLLFVAKCRQVALGLSQCNPYRESLLRNAEKYLQFIKRGANRELHKCREELKADLIAVEEGRRLRQPMKFRGDLYKGGRSFFAGVPGEIQGYTNPISGVVSWGGRFTLPGYAYPPPAEDYELRVDDGRNGNIRIISIIDGPPGPLVIQFKVNGPLQ